MLRLHRLIQLLAERADAAGALGGTGLGPNRGDAASGVTAAGEFAGVVFPGKGVYREVLPNERLSFTFEGEDATQPQILMTVVFEDEVTPATCVSAN